MSEEMKKQKARENARRYYQKNKQKVLAKQKEYVKKKYATDEEFRKKTYERNRKYVKNNIEKVREWKRKWANKHYKELREKGLLPPSKQEVIEDLQQKVEQLEKENDDLKNRLDNEVAENTLRLKEVEQLESIRKEAIKATKDVKQFVYDELVDRNVSGATETHCKIKDLLNILNKGSDKE